MNRPPRPPRQPKELLVELDSAAIRCAAAATALELAEQHPDRAAVRQIASNLPGLRDRLRELTSDIMDCWSVVRAHQVATDKAKAA